MTQFVLAVEHRAGPSPRNAGRTPRASWVKPTGRARLARACMLFLCTALLAAGSCTPRDPSFMPGASEGPRPVGGSKPDAGAKLPARWEPFDRVDQLEVLSPGFRSRGHGTGDWDAELRGSPGAGEKLDSLVPGSVMPVGTLLVQRHQQQQTAAPLGAFVMEKKPSGYFPEGGDWEYLVVGRDGRIEARGKLEACARCHAEAAADFVFPRVGPDPAPEPPDAAR